MNIRHKWQQTGFTCGAAAVAMILDIPEVEARKLALTTRTGTPLAGAAQALRGPGREAHAIRLPASIPLSAIGWALEEQSRRWPLYLHLEFPELRQGKTRKYRTTRHHAVVLFDGQLFDPGEWETLSIDTIGHLADEEVRLNSYVIVETLP